VADAGSDQSYVHQHGRAVMINGRCGSRRIILEQFGHRRGETFLILIWVLFEVGGLAGIPRWPSSGERRTLVGHAVGKRNLPPADDHAVAREVSFLRMRGSHVLGVVNVDREVLDRGNDDALRAASLFIYDELRPLDHSAMRREPPDHTLQSSALVKTKPISG